MIGKLNDRITINTSGYDQDEAGGLSAYETGSYTMWAKVRVRSGFANTSNEQQTWKYDYEFTVRYEKSRIIKSNQTVDFDDKRLEINSVSFEQEGKRRYAILRCTTTDNNV